MRASAGTCRYDASCIASAAASSVPHPWRCRGAGSCTCAARDPLIGWAAPRGFPRSACDSAAMKIVSMSTCSLPHLSRARSAPRCDSRGPPCNRTNAATYGICPLHTSGSRWFRIRRESSLRSLRPHRWRARAAKFPACSEAPLASPPPFDPSLIRRIGRALPASPISASPAPGVLNELIARYTRCVSFDSRDFPPGTAKPDSAAQILPTLACSAYLLVLSAAGPGRSRRDELLSTSRKRGCRRAATSRLTCDVHCHLASVHRELP